MGRMIIASDDFTRADSATLGSNWSDGPNSTAGGKIQLLSGTAANTGASDCDGFYNAAAFTPNQFAQATISALDTGSNDFSGVMVRASATDQVMGQMNKFAGTYGIFWYNGGVSTGIGNTIAVAPQVGDVIVLEVIDTTYSFYLNGVLRIRATNNAAPRSGAPGLIVSGDTTGTDKMDNWFGGNMVQPTVLRPKLRPRPFAPGLAR